MKLSGVRLISLVLFVALLALPAAMRAQVIVAAHAPYVAVASVPYAVAGPAVIAGEPACQWGYYSYYPYTCAPYGYYGPNWFIGGAFIGIGPWYGYRFGRGGYGGFGRGAYGRGAYGYGARGFASRGTVSRGFASRGVVPRGGGAQSFARGSSAGRSGGRR